MRIEFKRLISVDKSEVVDLMNNALVRRQMPLFRFQFDIETCDEFIVAKEKLWKVNGFGPWAFLVDERFAGWGGLQTMKEDVELAIVLNPHFWGIGKFIYQQIIDEAFNKLRLESIIVLLPPSRKRINGLMRLGFLEDGYLEISNTQFNRYRLLNPKFNLIDHE